MHLYLLTRGIKHRVDQFITELQGKYLPFEYPNKENTKLEPAYVQVSVRPIQLWEIVYPEASQDAMLTTIFGENGGKTQHKKHNKFIWAMRKALGALPIPDYKKDKFLPIFKADIEMNGIGIKPDYWQHLSGARYEKKMPDCFEGL